MSDKPEFSPLIPELLCTNVDASVAFYTGVLGFEIMYQRKETRFAMIGRDGAQIMLDELAPDSPRPWIAGPLEAPFGRGMNLEIDIKGVDALYERVLSSGATVFLPMEEKWYRRDDIDLGVRQFIVLDPDGYLLRFSERIGTRPAALKG